LRGFVRTPQGDINCFIRDLSETGAKLRFRESPAIADPVELHIPSKQQIVPSSLVWIDNCEVGVSFEPVAALGAPSSSDGELSVRMARLEDEIATLKEMLKLLQGQVNKPAAA
jgi:hypothetical protein